jgi:hypothetical protein
MCFLSNRIGDYPSITQGKTRIAGVNDGEELEYLDVSGNWAHFNCALKIIKTT